MPPKDTDNYDVLIIGAGISGLYAALNMPKGLRVAIADKYKKLGGRTFTFNQTIDDVKYSWEEGAARIFDSHRLLRGLVHDFHLKLVPISPEAKYKESGAYPIEDDVFEGALPVTLKPLFKLSPKVLSGTTVRKLLTEFHGEREAAALLNRHPYRAEMGVMRADMALQLFNHEFKSYDGYSVIAQGFSELIARMEKKFEKSGGTILRQHELVGMDGSQKAVFRQGPPSEGIGRPEVEIQARRIVFAIPSAALQRIPQFSDWPLLKHLVMKPLLRVFAVFPKVDGHVWFEGMKKLITATDSRYIIPNNPAIGSIQISYTDSTDAEPLIARLERDGEEGLGKFLVEDLRTLLADTYKTIPDPTMVKAYPWKEGVTYWLPGDYDPYAKSKEACRPFPKQHPNWFVCGESYSTRQCWAEGALEHTEMMLEVFRKTK